MATAAQAEQDISVPPEREDPDMLRFEEMVPELAPDPNPIWGFRE